MSHAGFLAVCAGTAERFHVDLLTGDAADHVWTGYEHPAIRRHDHDIGERGAVGGAACREAEYHGDLRDPP